MSKINKDKRILSVVVISLLAVSICAAIPVAYAGDSNPFNTVMEELDEVYGYLTDTIKPDLDDIKAKTDNLPSDPASTTDIMEGIMFLRETQTSTLRIATYEMNFSNSTYPNTIHLQLRCVDTYAQSQPFIVYNFIVITHHDSEADNFGVLQVAVENGYPSGIYYPKTSFPLPDPGPDWDLMDAVVDHPIGAKYLHVLTEQTAGSGDPDILYASAVVLAEYDLSCIIESW